MLVSHREPQRGSSCMGLCSEPASWLHAWHGRCLNCSFRAHFVAGNPPSCSQLLLSAFMSLPLPISFSFIWNPSLSVLSHLSLCLSHLPFIMLPYLTMSFDTSPLLSASVYSHPSFSLFYLSSFFPLFIPLPWSVSPFLSLSVLISLSNPTLSAR